MNVTLRNNTTRAIPIVLDHPAFRNRKAGFRRRAQTVINQGRDGSRSPRIVQREEPGSITLPARGVVEGLHPAIKNCRQVKGLLARGAVTIVPDKATSAPAARPAKPKRSAPKASATKTEKGDS